MKRADKVLIVVSLWDMTVGAVIYHTYRAWKRGMR